MNFGSHAALIGVSMFPIAFMWSCTPVAEPAPFRPPAQSEPSQISTASTLQQEGFSTPHEVSTITQVATPCTNDLTFVQDLTIPDDTVVPGAGSIDKQWLVSNTGTCDWGPTYRLKLAGGEALSAPLDQPLYPARAGAQATVRILFTTPQQAGVYQSVWQASGPDGLPFGDSIFMQIIVE